MKNKTILKKANELARLLYKSHGYDVPENFDFRKSDNPRVSGMFNLALIAIDFLKPKWNIEDVVCDAEIQEEEGEAC